MTDLAIELKLLQKQYTATIAASLQVVKGGVESTNILSEE